MNLPFLDLTSKEELSVSLPFIYLKVKLKLEMTHLRSALIYVESLKRKELNPLFPLG